MITVLMASYNGESFIRQQLDSILAQTVPLRIVVSDDGSRDGTREILEQYRRGYPQRVFLHHRSGQSQPQDVGSRMSGPQPAAGQAAGRTSEGGRLHPMPPAAANFFWLMEYAAKEDISDYVMLSDQDDVWFPDKAEVLLRRMEQLERSLGKDHPVLVHSDMEVVDQQLCRIHPSFFSYAHCDPDRIFFSEILVENPVTGGAVLMNRALLSLAAATPETCYLHDWWIALTASCFGTISCVRKPLYQYRQHDKNLVGATRTGSLQDLKNRLGRQKEVQENYRNMMRQAAAFGRAFKDRLNRNQRQILRAYLQLPGQSVPARWSSIRRNHFTKSSRLQTLGMCVAMPRVRRKKWQAGKRDCGNRREKGAGPGPGR